MSKELVMSEEEVRFIRKGYFISNHPSSTQCTIEGWKGYKYKATIIAAPVLDESGFLIDHNELHRAICTWVFENTLPSCEVTLQTLCYIVTKVLLDYGVKLKKLGMEIVPVDHRLLQGDWLELEPIGKNQGELLQAMPANAEYWCKFKKQ